MQIIIKNFGPIGRFVYDLDKNLIITYGNNNIGKSYSMQIVYLLLKTFIKNAPPVFNIGLMSFISEDILKKIAALMDSFSKSDKDEIEITAEIDGIVFSVFSSLFMNSFIDSCKNTFGNFDHILKKHPKIILTEDNLRLEINLSSNTVSGKMSDYPLYLHKTVNVRLDAKNDCNKKIIYYSDSTDKAVKVILDIVQGLLKKSINTIISRYADVYFLPASRSGIYSGMNSLSPIIAELSKSRNYLTKPIQLPGISELMSDYFISLSNINSGKNKEFAVFYNEIEENILQGKVAFDKNKNALLYKPVNVEDVFQMTEVSSMVSEISPIVAFLKYILSSSDSSKIHSKHILFIEEPEAHLHPQNQIALISVFAALSKAGIQLIMSSHSNYIFNKLNNLILGRELDYRDYEPILLQEGIHGSVSKILEIDELGASDENFIDTSEALMAEREEIIEKLNTEE